MKNGDYGKIKNFPEYGWIGIILTVVFWILNWSLTGLRTQWGFFPLWLGYCLIVNAFVCYRNNEASANSRRGGQAKAGLKTHPGERAGNRSSSDNTRNLKYYLLPFIISIPVWWLFEFFNFFTKNWLYDGREYFTDFEYFLLASLSFSTVMPAIFGTSELVSSFRWIKKFSHIKKFSPGKTALTIYFLVGIGLIILIIIYPDYFYPLIWVSLYFTIEPINVWLKNRTLLDDTAKGDWSLVFSLAAGSLICGFFWEMWNFYSYPKWVYNLPGLNFIHIFEMPVLGFLGYIPFSFELFAIYNLVTGLLTKNRTT